MTIELTLEEALEHDVNKSSINYTMYLYHDQLIS